MERLRQIKGYCQHLFLARASSTVFPWLAMSNSGQSETNPSSSRSINAVKRMVRILVSSFHRGPFPRVDTGGIHTQDLAMSSFLLVWIVALSYLPGKLRRAAGRPRDNAVLREQALRPVAAALPHREPVCVRTRTGRRGRRPGIVSEGSGREPRRVEGTHRAFSRDLRCGPLRAALPPAWPVSRPSLVFARPPRQTSLFHVRRRNRRSPKCLVLSCVVIWCVSWSRIRVIGAISGQPAFSFHRGWRGLHGSWGIVGTELSGRNCRDGIVGTPYGIVAELSGHLT